VVLTLVCATVVLAAAATIGSLAVGALNQPQKPSLSSGPAANSTQALTPVPPTRTQALMLTVNPSSIDASNPNVCPNGKCEMTLSSPNSNALNIDWQATITIRAGAGTLIIGS